MIRFSAADLKQNEYTHMVLGNDGEEQLVIVSSWGQDMRSPLAVIAAQCDGGVTLLHKSTDRYTQDQFRWRLMRTIVEWGLSGLSPTEDERHEIGKQADLITDTVVGFNFDMKRKHG